LDVPLMRGNRSLCLITRERSAGTVPPLLGREAATLADITEALWGTRVSPSTVSDLNKKIYGTIEAWRNRPIEGEHPYVYLDGIVLKRSWAGEVRNVSLLVAIGVNESG